MLRSGKYKIKDVGFKKGSRAENGSKVTKRLSIVAWNVWKEGKNIPNSNMEHRYNEIVKIITGKNPDIICLQQVQKFKERHLQQFLNSFKGSHYYFPDPQLTSFNSSIILCKYPAKFYEVKFSKGFKTKPMSICQFKINCRDGKTRTVVAHSVHLKARKSNQETQPTRLLQLQLIQKINQRYDISVIACSQLEKKQFKRKVNVTQFQRLGNYSVGIHSTVNFMVYLYDKIVRSPSDHLGVYAVLFLNF